MPKYEVEYTCNFPESGVIDIETPTAIDMDEVEDQALLEIKESFPDVRDITVDSIKVLS